MDDSLQKLEDRKRALEERRDEISNEIRRLESLIIQHRTRRRANLFGEKITMKTKAKMNARAFIVECISRAGSMTTSDIHEMVEENGLIIKYVTLRSHLLRMKTDGIIMQDTKKKWFLVNPADQ